MANGTDSGRVNRPYVLSEKTLLPIGFAVGLLTLAIPGAWRLSEANAEMRELRADLTTMEIRYQELVERTAGFSASVDTFRREDYDRMQKTLKIVGKLEDKLEELNR